MEIGALACTGAFAALIWQVAATSPRKLWILAIMLSLAFVTETTYRLERKREISFPK